MNTSITATHSLPTLASLSAAISSNISFSPYDSQLDIKEEPNSRVVKCLYQVNKKTGKKAGENSYIRIPTAHLTEEMIASRIEELTPYVLNYLQGVEDTIVKEKHKGGETALFPASLSMDAIIARLEESEVGARLNKEKIEEWFQKYLAESLMVLFAEKLGINESSGPEMYSKLELILGAYKAKFCSLASPKTSYNESDIAAMLGVIESTSAAAESLIGKRFVKRLKGMNKKEEDLLMAL